MVKLLRGGMHHPRGGMYPPRGIVSALGFSRFPMQPPPMMGKQLPFRGPENFTRPPPGCRHPLPPLGGRPFPGPAPPHPGFSYHPQLPLPPKIMGPSAPRGPPVGPNGRPQIQIIRANSPQQPMAPASFRGNSSPLDFSPKICQQPFIRTPNNVKRLGQSGRAKQKRNKKPKERSEGAFYCEACDRSWKTEELLDAHKKEHRTCGVDGCTLSAHPKVIEKHIQLQHVTGLYKRITASYNADDVAKWIEERKSRFPTLENIQKKKAQREEMFARGENMPQNDRPNRTKGGRGGRRQFGNRGRGGRKRRHQNKRRKQNDDTTEKKDEDNSLQTQDNPPGFHIYKTDKSWEECWRGNLPQFPGTAAFPEIKVEIVDTKEDEEFSDDEWQGGNVLKPVFMSSALASLSGNYASDSDDNDAEQLLQIEPNSPKSHENCSINVQELNCKESDKHLNIVEDNLNIKQNPSMDCSMEADSDSGPEEEPVKRDDHLGNCDEELEVIKESNENSKVKGNLSDSKNKMIEKECKVEPNSRKGARQYNTRLSQRRKKQTLLEKLLSSEIHHERNVILQCVRYVVQNNFLNER